MQRKVVSYENIAFMVDQLVSRVSTDYDYIVGIGRGGLIPATMLAYKLNKKVLILGVSTYNNTTQTDKHYIYQPVNLPDAASKFLVVDDICDTGNTFKIFKEIYCNTIHKFEYASLFAKDKSSHMVDYYGFSTPEGMWLTFPWENI